MSVWVLDPGATATTTGLRARLQVALAVPSATTRRAASPDTGTGTGTGGGYSAAGPRSAAVAGGGGPAGSPSAGPTEHETGRSLGGCSALAAGRGLRHRCTPSTTGGTGCAEQAHAAPIGPTPSLTGIPDAATIGTDRTAESDSPPERRHVLLDLGRGPVEPGQLAAAAADLGPSGVLAVATFSHHEDGRLFDPRPELIAAATAAGLAHLQHIVTITRHATDRAAWALGPDLSLFQTPATAEDAASSTPGENP
ncbi:hypothetical protein [Pseudonocardia sp. HH130630-07]|uniref:hypothetical protein n=1 Tax=Pseudonocardia sp. HH130630-07 TaxID=1690815 RepID=UPI000AE793B7|nr:hypothetical protein [Pseudonocardia sp. HH130630-07]